MVLISDSSLSSHENGVSALISAMKKPLVIRMIYHEDSAWEGTASTGFKEFASNQGANKCMLAFAEPR